MLSRIKNPKLRAFAKFWASLRLAVTVVLGIAFVCAYGTIVESQFDATRAQKLVYHSWWSYTIFGLLMVNLSAVMMDRWPWKRQHVGFLFAHIGIITLLLGSIVTRYYGLDGSIRFGIGEEKTSVIVPETDLMVWGSLDGNDYKILSAAPYEVDFLVRQPSEQKPHDLSQGGQEIKVVEYIPYAIREEKITESTAPGNGPALRFQLQNERVNMSEWISLEGGKREDSMDLGPAQVYFTTRETVPSFGNQIVFTVHSDSEVSYQIRSAKNAKEIKKGILKAGDVIETGWMGLRLRVLKYISHAKTDVTYKPLERPTPVTTSALRVRFNGKDEYLGLNSMLKLFSDESVYLITYGNRQIPLGFPIKLTNFHVGRYQGTLRAASYESEVQVPQEARPPLKVLVAMNEPLQHRGFTFYQASFEENEMGEPTASILSVNHDPGRWAKYLGSLMIVAGTIHMFYFRNRPKKKKEQVAHGV